ncbi:hypothetical protein N7540_001054 [Penicillium herquei]|nr:hypothetical protein N7540_001054 [Penicillium herquei]
MDQQQRVIIDPDGEVTILLRNANSPFAHPIPKVKPSDNSTAPVPDSQANSSNTEQDINNETVANEDFKSSPCIEFQVSAKHLILASPVFKSMLTGGWKESVDYQQNGFVEIDAEDWDVESFTIVLRLIHGQFYLIPKSRTLEQVAKTFVIADYYQVKETMSVMFHAWTIVLFFGASQFPSRSLIMSVWVSWFLGDDEPFKNATSNVITHSDGEIQSLGLPIPAQVIDAMNEARVEAIRDVFTSISEVAWGFIGGDWGCSFECRSIMAGALQLEQHANGFWSPSPRAPYPKMQYSDVVHTVRSFKEPQWYDNKASPSPSRKKKLAPHECLHSSLASLFTHLNPTVQGLKLNDFVVSNAPTLKRKHTDE